MKKITQFAPAFFTVICLLILWETSVILNFISPSFLPAPTSAFYALFEYRTIILEHAAQTLLETLIGLGLAIVLGVLVGIIIFSSDKIRKAVYPLLVLSQTIPIIALAPLLLVWFGFDLIPKVIIVVLYCFFPIAVAVADALAHTNQDLVDLLKSMKASSWQILKYARFPSSLPAFFTGLKISTTYAITGAIVGEYVGAYRGLGIFMQTSANAHAINLVFAVLFVIIFITLILLTVVSMVEKLAIPWKK